MEGALKTEHQYHPKIHPVPSATQTPSPSSSFRFSRLLQVSPFPDLGSSPAHLAPTSCLPSPSHHTASCTSLLSHPPSAALAYQEPSPSALQLVSQAFSPPLSWLSCVLLPPPRRLAGRASASTLLPPRVSAFVQDTEPNVPLHRPF